MRITTINESQYNRLIEIQQKQPILTFQNNSYEYIDKSKFTDEDKQAFEEIEALLKIHIDGFDKFFNFNINKQNEVRIRFDYNYGYDGNGIYFIGVGYLTLRELMNGFDK